jgi:hypothetical protein
MNRNPKANERTSATASWLGTGSCWNFTAASSAAHAGGDEQHRDEEQAAGEEHGGEEAILTVADQVPDDGDEPQERDAGERREVDADERHAIGMLSEVEVSDLGRRARAGRMAAQQHDRGDEEDREGEPGDTGGPRRLEAALPIDGRVRQAGFDTAIVVCERRGRIPRTR